MVGNMNDHQTLSDLTSSSEPVKLKNEYLNGKFENLCFFNAVLQLLYSIPEFHLFLKDPSLYPSNINDEMIRTLIQLFTEMDTHNSVRTSSYIKNIGLNHYVFGSQYDAQDCLQFIINQCFLSHSQSIFGLCIFESIWCEGKVGCNRRSEKLDWTQILQLTLYENEDQLQTVEELFHQFFDPCGSKLSDMNLKMEDVE